VAGTKQTESAPAIQIGTVQHDPALVVMVTPGGPYIVKGGIVPLQIETIEQKNGHSWTYGPGRTFEAKDGMALCRCGHSRHKPFCDGSHKTAGVDLTETASFEPLLNHSQEIDGPHLALTDNEKYCAFARFCDNGQRIWNEVQMEGAAHAQLATYMAHQCPSGRLIVWDLETQKPIEDTDTPASISILEDPGEGCSGPLALRGGIRVQSASGRSYEVRNRQTLCRCGQSSNKPFCDGSHASIKFDDGLT
jgi:CDGSH-type Zn-finger protein